MLQHVLREGGPCRAHHLTWYHSSAQWEPQGLPNAIPEPAARFYAAAVVLGLEYMQRRDLVWRCAIATNGIT